MDTSVPNTPDTNSAFQITILIVDDTPDNLSLLSKLLKDTYKVRVANSGDRALQIAKGLNKPDLILLDIMMPGLSGYDVLRTLKRDPTTQHIPIIFLTGMTDEKNEQHGLELGAVDYITKPISAPIVLARIKAHLENKAAADFLRDKNDYLQTEIARRVRELSVVQEISLLALSALIENRHAATSNYIRYIPNYIKLLAEKLKSHLQFKHFLTDNTIAELIIASRLYDIGKLGIPDSILLKPGALTPEEFEIIKSHTTLGKNAIEHAEKVLGTELNSMRIAKELALYHHEKWNGTGYPTKIKGDTIPIPARLMSVVDAYNALTSKRTYKDQVSHDQAVKNIIAGKGTHFDPEIVNAFIIIQNEFRTIRVRFHTNSFM